MAKAIWNGITLAESDDIAHVEGNAYFPNAAVNWDHLRPSTETTETFCHWKGFASYLDIVGDTGECIGAAWRYEKPYDQAVRIADHVAFWKDVEVVDGPEGPGYVEPSPSQRGSLRGWEALCWLLRHSEKSDLGVKDVEQITGIAEADIDAAWNVYDVQRYARRYRWSLEGGSGGDPVRLHRSPGEPVSG